MDSKVKYTEPQIEAFRKCVAIIKRLPPQDAESVCILMFYYWVHFIIDLTRETKNETKTTSPRS